MLTDKTLTFATANLFNFIAPPDAFYEFNNIYEEEAWLGKCQWTSDQLSTLNADVVGLQEVFSIEQAKTLCEKLGYCYFATVEQPHVESDYIYSKPVVAVASKYPITRVTKVTPPKEQCEGYATTLPDFSRHPVHVIIDVPELGEFSVYVCHLKSQRPTESDHPDLDNPILGSWLSSQQRGWEAVMLRLFMEAEYKKAPKPTVLLGDMNQAISSDTTGYLVKQVRQQEFGLLLKDSWDLFDSSEQVRPATHYHFANGNVLDYVLMSQEFHTDSDVSMADIVRYQTLDSHLINPIYERDKFASDHAFLAVTARFVL